MTELAWASHEIAALLAGATDKDVTDLKGGGWTVPRIDVDTDPETLVNALRTSLAQARSNACPS